MLEVDIHNGDDADNDIHLVADRTSEVHGDEDHVVTPTPDSCTIVASLCRLMGVGDASNHLDVGATTPLEDGYFDFSRLFLTFKHPLVEKKFQKQIAKSGIVDFSARLFLGEAAGLFIIQLNLQCTSAQDQAVATYIMALLMGMSTYLHLIGTNHSFHAPITFVVYNSILVIAFLGLTGDCGGLELRGEYVGIIAGCYLCVALFTFQYCLGVKIQYRMGIAMLTLVITVACMAIRINTYHDDVAKIDPLPLCGMALIILSFFPEYSLRSAFRSKMRLRQLQADATSKSATMANSALSVMLPTFVTEKIVALAREGDKTNNNSTSTHHRISETATLSSRHSSSLVNIDFNAIAATWEYGHVVIMFAKFHSDDPSFTPSIINSTVQTIEEIIDRFVVMKVKTIGSTIMLVTGTDNDDVRTRQEQVSSMMDAAIMIRRCVFQGRLRIPGLHYRLGVHCGPCFGAVIGGNGAVFDLFGDTVNTASRMCSTAGDGWIQFSTPVHTLLLPTLPQTAIHQCPPIKVKGKGIMNVFALTEHDNNSNSSSQCGKGNDGDSYSSVKQLTDDDDTSSRPLHDGVYM